MNLSSITQVTTDKIANEAVTTVKIDDGAVTAAKLAAGVIPSFPAGAILPFAMNSVPTGWLSANGASVGRSTYATLFSAIGTTYGAGNGSTTFNLPDLRGYFVRGAGTNGDGTASGSFGVEQADSFKSHTHGTGNRGGYARNISGNSWDAGIYFGLSDDFPTKATGGSETRPKNIALLYCIKF